MQYADIVFPPRIAMGAQRRPRWNTTVVQTVGGLATTNQNWSRVRHEYDVSFAVRNATDYEVILDHFHSARGKAKKWPFPDKLDYKVTAAKGVLLDEGGSPTIGYQLAKRYGTGVEAYDRKITRPKTGTLVIFRLRAGITTDITASTTIAYTTGMVTIGSGVYLPGDVLSWSGEFLVPCRYDTDDLPSLIVDRNSGPDGQLLVQCSNIMVVEVRE